MLPPQQLCVFVSDKLPGKIAFEKASLLKQPSNHFGGGDEDFALCSAMFFVPSHWRKRVLASGPASESLVRHFSQVSPNFDSSLWIKGPQFSRSTGFGLWFPVWLKVLAFGLHVVSAVIREELRCYFCFQNGSEVKGAFVTDSVWEGQGGLDPYHYRQAVWLCLSRV